MGYEYFPMLKMVDILKGWSKENDVEKILEVWLEVGVFAMIKPRNVRRCFKLASKGTIVDGARLFIKTLPGLVSCNKCGYIGKAKKIYYLRLGTYEPSLKCPKCYAAPMDVVQGKEYVLKEIKFKRKGSELPEKLLYEG